MLLKVYFFFHEFTLLSDINVYLQLYVTFTLNLFIYFFSSVDTVQHFGYDEMETGLRFTMFWGEKFI